MIRLRNGHFPTLLFFLVGILPDLCILLRLDITPDHVTFTSNPSSTPSGQPSVHLSCHLDDNESRAVGIIEMTVSKAGRKIVSLRSGNRIRFHGHDNHTDLQAEGQIHLDNLFESFLNLSLLEPTLQDSGKFECSIDYIDWSGDDMKEVASAYLKVKDPKLNDLQTTMDRLQQRVKQQQQQLDIINKQVSKHVAFFVTNKNSVVWPHKGQNIILPDVLIQEGEEGYDKATGVFSAPISGLYTFDLALAVKCPTTRTCQLSTELRKNKDTLLASLMVGDKDGTSQSAVSILTRLQAGDTVKVVVVERSSSNYLVHGQYNLFSGHLVQLE